MDMRVTWLGQAGYLLETSEVVVAIDPFCGSAKGNSVRMYPNDIEKNAYHPDLILTTHAHWDHFDAETYRDYVIPAKIAGPGTCMKALQESGLTVPGELLERGQEMTICDLHIRAVMADHDVDSVGYVITYKGKTLYFTGDSLLTVRVISENCDLRPDVMFVCINGKLGNMNYYEAATYCHLLQAKAAVPMHYDMICHNTEDPKEFSDRMAVLSPETKVTVMERLRAYDLQELL